jgi:hypothetical protein
MGFDSRSASETRDRIHCLSIAMLLQICAVDGHVAARVCFPLHRSPLAIFGPSFTIASIQTVATIPYIATIATVAPWGDSACTRTQ